MVYPEDDPISQEDWIEIFSKLDNPNSLGEMSKSILENLDGYGIEYGFSRKVDEISLINAFRATAKMALAKVSK